MQTWAKKVEELIAIRENVARIKEFEVLSGMDIVIVPMGKNPFDKIRAHMTVIDAENTEPEVLNYFSLYFL